MTENNLSLSNQLEIKLAQADSERSKANYKDGIALATEVLEQARQHSLTHIQGRAQMLLAMQLPRQGLYHEAVQHYRSAISIWQSQNDIEQLASALNEQSVIYVQLGLLDEALENLTRSMEYARTRQNPTLLFWAYNRIGVVLEHLEKHEEAKKFMLQALVLSQQLDIEARFCVLNNLADFCVLYVRELLSHKQPQLAEQATGVATEGLLYAQQALKLARQSQNPYREALILANYGALQAYSGDFSGARHNIILSGNLARQHGFQSLGLDAELLLARVSWLHGDVQGAIDMYENILPALIELDERLTVLHTHLEISQACQQIGLMEKAFSHYKRYHQMEREQRSSVAASRAKLMTSVSELSDARRELERTRMQAELDRIRQEESEVEKQALRQVIEELNKKIHIDDLTNIHNRRFMMKKLREAIKGSEMFCVALIDVDHFKNINDTYGHQRGDVLLHNLAQLIQNGLPPEAIVSRHGGEEFLILFMEQQLDSCHEVCEQIRQQVMLDVGCMLEADKSMTISIGLSQRHSDDELELIIERADKALYEAKNGGRNCVVVEA
ncbi:tetratricopeptide repeat-containing diguanylate cyclase [Gynuella sunshinyii]|uniref:diguanylate cyclase n=1 Tax=Gynuella sunshinyii YC6258 TaxID=1445510 RepID=A0A0C5VTJ5_9GAMM|nr:tetratricopeptide repeat-containing diguanylate cyclase [Gynuella sunshinyii]AJQ93639.1 response regulator containing a CheY-like receiver domain and a GGDEF domain [Gynuella sunshinyii YC6258]